MDFSFDIISGDGYDRQRAVHEPLIVALRRFLEAGVRTTVNDDAIRAAQAAIESATEILERSSSDGTTTLRHAETGRPLARANPAVGLRNAIAPPMVIHSGNPRDPVPVHEGRLHAWPPAD